MLDTRKPMLATLVHEDTCEGHCPTCRQYTLFTFLGEQRWPQRVVEMTGCPPVNRLWTCEQCQTTVSEMDILP